MRVGCSLWFDRLLLMLARLGSFLCLGLRFALPVSLASGRRPGLPRAFLMESKIRAHVELYKHILSLCLWPKL